MQSQHDHREPPMQSEPNWPVEYIGANLDWLDALADNPDFGEDARRLAQKIRLALAKLGED